MMFDATSVSIDIDTNISSHRNGFSPGPTQPPTTIIVLLFNVPLVAASAPIIALS
jgi:hypothetical protein